jgi:hypothetical protein
MPLPCNLQSSPCDSHYWGASIKYCTGELRRNSSITVRALKWYAPSGENQGSGTNDIPEARAVSPTAPALPS